MWPETTLNKGRWFKLHLDHHRWPEIWSPRRFMMINAETVAMVTQNCPWIAILAGHRSCDLWPHATGVRVMIFTPSLKKKSWPPPHWHGITGRLSLGWRSWFFSWKVLNYTKLGYWKFRCFLRELFTKNRGVHPTPIPTRLVHYVLMLVLARRPLGDERAGGTRCA